MSIFNIKITIGEKITQVVPIAVRDCSVIGYLGFRNNRRLKKNLSEMHVDLQQVEHMSLGPHPNNVLWNCLSYDQITCCHQNAMNP